MQTTQNSQRCLQEVACLIIHVLTYYSSIFALRKLCFRPQNPDVLPLYACDGANISHNDDDDRMPERSPANLVGRKGRHHQDRTMVLLRLWPSLLGRRMRDRLVPNHPQGSRWGLVKFLSRRG